MIDAIGIAEQCIGEAGEIDEPVPIAVLASEPLHLAPEQKTDACEGHFGCETGEAGRRARGGTGKAEILVNDNDSILRPAKLTCLGRKRILTLGRLAIVLDLGGAGLAQIDDRLAAEVVGSDLGALIHRASPPLLARLACGRSTERGARVRPCVRSRRCASTAWSESLLVSSLVSAPSRRERQGAIACLLLPSGGADSDGRLRRALMILRKWSKSLSLPRS